MSSNKDFIAALRAGGKHAARFMDLMVTVTGYLGSAFIVAAMLVVTYDVISRYIFNRPTVWAVTLSGAMLMWSTLLLAAWVLRQEAHIKIDFILEGLEAKRKALLNCITGLLAAACCVIFLWKGIAITWNDFATGAEESVGLFALPRGLVMISIPVGMFFVLWQVLKRFKGHWDQYRAQGTEKPEGSARSGEMSPQ